MSERVALWLRRGDDALVESSDRGFHLGAVPELPTRVVRGDVEVAALDLSRALGAEGTPTGLGRLRLRGDVLHEDLHVFAVDAPANATSGTPLESLSAAQAAGRPVGPALAEVLRLRCAGAARAADDALPPREAFRVAPYVEWLSVRTPTLPPATHTNAFVLGGSRAVLVEPASSDLDEIERMAAHVEARIAEGTRFEALVLTHHHPDHVGGATALAERLALPIWAHAMTASRLSGRIRIDRELADGDRIELGETSVDVLHTPGHAPGHLCFVERRSGAMVVGDMVAGVGTILVEPYDGDMQLYLDSLARMRKVGASMLLPAHGGVILGPDDWLAHYVAHRLAREEKVLSAVRELGSCTVDELVPVAYADTPVAAWVLARMASLAHLQKLVSEGRVVRDGERYGATGR